MKFYKIDEVSKFFIENVKNTLQSNIRKCYICKTQLHNNENYICTNCEKDISIENEKTCNICNRLSSKDVCDYCLEHKKPFVNITSTFKYAHPTNYLLNEFKEQGMRAYGNFFADEMIKKFKSASYPKIDLITCVPANNVRKVLRLCDPPHFFAKKLSKATEIHFTNKCLKRKAFTHDMRKFSKEERLSAAKNNFISLNFDIKNKVVLLIDDVITSGASTHVCSQLLMESGAKSVYILSCCVVVR